MAVKVQITLAQFISIVKRGGHPLAAISGIVDAKETDLAGRFDEILYR